MPVTFHTTLLLSGKSATGIVVPPEVVESLGAGKRPPVRVTIGNHTYLSTVAVMSGDFMIPVSEENRNLAGVKAGDELAVSIELDTQPRVTPVPEDLQAALDAVPSALAAYEALAPSRKKEFVRQVEDAKTAETRSRRIAGIVDKLA